MREIWKRAWRYARNHRNGRHIAEDMGYYRDYKHREELKVVRLAQIILNKRYEIEHRQRKEGHVIRLVALFKRVSFRTNLKDYAYKLHYTPTPEGLFHFLNYDRESNNHGTFGACFTGD